MTPPRVFIIILQFNNSQDTIGCLNSVKELDYPNYNVIIVDNGSDVNPVKSRNAGTLKELFDGVKHIYEIRDWIKNERDLNSTYFYPVKSAEGGAAKQQFNRASYSLLTTHSNSGYSGGNNIGIKHALDPVRSLARAKGASPKDLGEATSNGVKHGADYVLILNPDTTLEKDALTKLVEAAESDSQIGILGPAIDENGKMVYGGKIKWLKPELSHLVVEPLSSLSGSTTKFYIPGAAILIKKKVIEKIGLLDERYFLYFEDADYCECAKRAGFKLTVVPEAVIHHKPSSSTSSLGAPLLLRYHYRNAHLFNWKNGPIWVKMTLPFWSSFIIIKQLAKIITGRKPEISKAILAGVGDFYRGHFGQII